MQLKYIALFLVAMLAIQYVAALEAEAEAESRTYNSDDDDDSSSNGHIPAYCRRLKWNGQPRPAFTRRHKLMLDEFNLNRNNGEVWQNPTRTYAIIQGTDSFVPISDLQYFWSDVTYNQAACQFEYIQVWPAFDAARNKIVYRVQKIGAVLNRPAFTADNREASSSYIPVWLTPPLFEHSGILAADGYQTLVGPHAADTSFFNRNAQQNEISNEQRSVLIANQRRYYSLMLQLDAIPPGFATKELKMFWYSTTVQAPRDVRIAITKFIAGQLPLLPDPTNPGVPGMPNIYIYVPPNAARDDEVDDSPVTPENISYRPVDAAAAAELYQDYLRRHAE